MEDLHNLSLRLYDVLDKVGASEKMRKLHKLACTSTEILNTLHSTLYGGGPMHSYICGSTYEGSVTPDLESDIDEIHCLISIPVVLDKHASTTRDSLLMVYDQWTYPGYVKLQGMRRGRPLTGDHKKTNKWFRVDDVGRLCMRHIPGSDIGGPADKDVDQYGFHFRDNVPAYKCKTVPEFASNRLGELNRRGLISDIELETLKGLGCMFVRAGHFLSTEKDIEWRLSLTLQERYLMSKLNLTQHKVYILLKMIKRNMIEKDCKVFTSYHCKTCILYAVEMTPAQSWTPGNLISCLMQCIKLLILWLTKNYCPNFLNRDQNLFLKQCFSKFRKPLLQTMENLLRPDSKFLFLLNTDHIGKILSEGVSQWKKTLSINVSEHRGKLLHQTIMSVVNVFWQILPSLCDGQYDTSSLVTALDSLQRRETISEHTIAETQLALGYLKPWLHLLLAKRLACLSSIYQGQDISCSRVFLKLADIHFHKAENTDLVNVRLAKASLLYKFEQYEASLLLLQQIDHDFSQNVRRSCSCVNLFRHWFRSEQDKQDMERKTSRLSVQKFQKGFIACCVVFLPSQKQIIPTPLKYEMFRSLGTQLGSRDKDLDYWFDWSVLDAKVYLYLLQYLVSEKLQKDAYKKKAIDNLHGIIKEDERIAIVEQTFCQLGHRETAYNVLGWVYMQEQRYGDALQCFLKSWEIRPFHNAAKFHMRDLLTQVTGKPKQGCVNN